MSMLASVKSELEYVINNAVPVLDKAVELIPSDKLEFKPNNNLGSIKWLAIHAYNGPYVYTKALQLGKLTHSDYKEIDFDGKNFNTIKDIQDYANRFKRDLNDLSAKLTEKDLKKTITYDFDWGKWTLTGYESIRILFVELVHHRAQLCTYLRLLNIKPPMIYPFM